MPGGSGRKLRGSLLEIGGWRLLHFFIREKLLMQQPPILEFTILLSLLASVIYGQNLKVDVNLVNVFATVKDDRGNFITDLSKEDFRVYDDDQLQDVRVFEKQDKVDSSIGLLMDASGSMVDIIPYMRCCVRDLERTIRQTDD